MKRKFIFTPEAEADVLAIWVYVADDATELAADRVIARLYDECQKLGAMPGIGHWRENLLDRRHKFWNVWSYLIVYRWQAEPIQVIAVVHGSRELDLWLANRGDAASIENRQSE